MPFLNQADFKRLKGEVLIIDASAERRCLDYMMRNMGLRTNEALRLFKRVKRRMKGATVGEWATVLEVIGATIRWKNDQSGANPASQRSDQVDPNGSPGAIALHALRNK